MRVKADTPIINKGVEDLLDAQYSKDIIHRSIMDMVLCANDSGCSSAIAGDLGNVDAISEISQDIVIDIYAKLDIDTFQVHDVEVVDNKLYLEVDPIFENA